METVHYAKTKHKILPVTRIVKVVDGFVVIDRYTFTWDDFFEVNIFLSWEI